MARCPECGGPAKWRSPFYVCEVCGLALRRHEYERMHNLNKDRLFEARETPDVDEKQKRRKAYLDWWNSSKK